MIDRSLRESVNSSYFSKLHKPYLKTINILKQFLNQNVQKKYHKYISTINRFLWWKQLFIHLSSHENTWNILIQSLLIFCEINTIVLLTTASSCVLTSLPPRTSQQHSAPIFVLPFFEILWGNKLIAIVCCLPTHWHHKQHIHNMTGQALT